MLNASLGKANNSSLFFPLQFSLPLLNISVKGKFCSLKIKQSPFMSQKLLFLCFRVPVAERAVLEYILRMWELLGGLFMYLLIKSCLKKANKSFCSLNTRPGGRLLH